jgi:hypothetical protein
MEIRLVGRLGFVGVEFGLLHRRPVHLLRRRVMRHGLGEELAAGLLALGFARIGVGLGFAVGFERGLAVGDRDAVIVGMDLVEGEKAVTVSAILDEGGLERRLHPRHLGEIDVTLDLLLGGRLVVEFDETSAVEHHHPGLFGVGCVDKHALGHAG